MKRWAHSQELRFGGCEKDVQWIHEIDKIPQCYPYSDKEVVHVHR